MNGCLGFVAAFVLGAVIFGAVLFVASLVQVMAG